MQTFLKIMKVAVLCLVVSVFYIIGSAFAQTNDGETVYLPLVFRQSIPPSPTPTPTASPTVSPTLPPTPTPTRPPAQGNVIDHYSVSDFDQIPANYIQAAIQLKSLFRHASVGGNINDGLNCLGNVVTPRPYFCDSGLSADEIFYDPIYDRSNWDFEYHALPNPNPAWWNKVNYFIDRVNNLSPGEYEIVAFKFGYVDGADGSNIDDLFFLYNPGGQMPSVYDLEDLETAHPDKTLVYWTMGLARLIGTADSESFNQQMRAYASANNKVLMDIADILSHDPNGLPCYDGNGNGYEAICQNYTDELEGGHLNARGMQRMAKAYWVLMAKLAGWDGTP